MPFGIPTGLALAFVTSIALTLFAIVVGALGRFRGAALWFMLFEGGFGLTAALGDFAIIVQAGAKWYDEPAWVSVWLWGPTILTAAVAMLGLSLLLFRFPSPASPVERRHFVWCMIPVVAMTASISGYLVSIAWNVPHVPLHAILFLVGLGALWVLIGLMLSGSLFLASRYQTASAPARRQIALMAASIGLYPALYVGWVSFKAFAASDYPLGAPFVVLAFCVGTTSFLWLRTAREIGGVAPRNLAILVLVPLLAGMVFGSLTPDDSPSGYARIIAILILGYAVLQNELLGLDVKVRFAISKSAVAAIFLGVFFVVAQVAQNWFGSSYGPVFGGITAGLLLFAISPIQRIAERVAHAAVPVASGVSAGVAAVPAASGPARSGVAPSGQREETYCNALRFALHDRACSREEELHLFRLADHLGISAGRAMELRHEVEKEVRSA